MPVQVRKIGAFLIVIELFDNIPYSFATDIWAMGCFLYELLTLDHPFKGASLSQLVKNVTTGQYVTPSAFVQQTYSPYLLLLISKMLTVNQKARPSIDDVLYVDIEHH